MVTNSDGEHPCAARQGRAMPATGTAADYHRDILRAQLRAGAGTDIAPTEPRFGPTNPLFSLLLSIRARDSEEITTWVVPSQDQSGVAAVFI